MPKNYILESREGAIEGIRKIHGFDNPQRLAQAIDILESWIQKQDHIVKKDFSKKYLEMKLIMCKGSVERAKKQIDRMCTMKTLLPNFFTMTNAKLEMQNALDLMRIYPLPKLTNDYYRVLVYKINTKNISMENITQFYQFLITSAEYIMGNDYANGFIIMADYSDINLFELLTKVSAVELQQFLTIMIEGYGARIKNIHFLTDSRAIDLLIKMIQQFVSEKIGKRLQAHPTLEELQKVVPIEILPAEYGGKERSGIQLWAEWVEALSTKEHVEYIKMMKKACTDESRRHSVKFNEEILGMPGSFRSLSVD